MAGPRDQAETKEYNIGRIRLMWHDLQSVALTLVATGRASWLADETIATLTRPSYALGIQSTEHSRHAYREILFPGAPPSS
jgi:fructose-bisphosphate aldolase class 1